MKSLKRRSKIDMWVVAKINHLETQTFKSQLKKHLGFDIQFYNPLICIKKVRKQKSINQSRPILNSYINLDIFYSH